MLYDPDLKSDEQIALTATGFIWVRWSFVITPINYSLAGVCIIVCIPLTLILNEIVSLPFQVNFCVGLSGLTQLARIAKYVYLPRVLICRFFAWTADVLTFYVATVGISRRRRHRMHKSVVRSGMYIKLSFTLTESVGFLFFFTYLL
jgi:hypothetical protein